MVITPSFTTNVTSNFTLSSGTTFGTAAMIADSDWGDSTAVGLFSSYNEVFRKYKSGNLVTAADKFFAAGGTSLTVIRVEGATSAKASIILTTGATNKLTITALYNGTYGNNITVLSEVSGSARKLTISDGTTTEIYTDTTIAGFVTQLTSSVLVRGTSNGTGLFDASAAANLTGGVSGTPADVDYVTAFNNYLLTAVWDYLVIPGKTANTFHLTFSGLLDNRAANEQHQIQMED